MIDNRLLDCDTKMEIEENFNRVLNNSDTQSGNISDVAADVAYVKHGHGIELYASGNSTAVSIPTGATFTLLSLAGITVNDDLGGLTYSTENGNITADESGVYYVSATFSSRLGTTDVIWDTAIFLNGIELPNLHMRRRFSTSGYTFNVCLSGMVSLSADDVIDIRVKHNNAGAVEITTEYANITAFKIADMQEV